MKEEYVLVYGTLKKNNPLHGYLRLAQFMGTVRLPYFKLFNLGPFPAAKYTGDEKDTIATEMYRVDRYTLSNLDRVEGFVSMGSPYNHYDRMLIELDDKQAWIYTQENPKGKEIENGEW